MTLPSDLMQSLVMPAFTNYRASGDYAGTSNFDIGGSSLLGWALGLRPSKDNFWTRRPPSQVRTGKPWPVTANPGSNCELNAMIATLSTGPVGIADKAGHTNKTIVLRAVRSDGLIIQPDRPATFIEGMFDSHSGLYPNSHIWASHSTLSGSMHYYVLSIDVHQPYQLQTADLYPTPLKHHSYVVHRWGTAACSDGLLALHSGCVQIAKWMPALHNDRGIAVANDTHVFDLHQLSPVLSNGWVLLGDLDRYAAASSKRFAAVQTEKASLELTVVGAPGEHVRVTALRSATGRTDEAQSTSEGTEWTVVVRLAVFARDCAVQPVHGQLEPACVISLVLNETQHKDGRSIVDRDHLPLKLDDAIQEGYR